MSTPTQAAPAQPPEEQKKGEALLSKLILGILTTAIITATGWALSTRENLIRAEEQRMRMDGSITAVRQDLAEIRADQASQNGRIVKLETNDALRQRWESEMARKLDELSGELKELKDKRR